ncbi:MULTISPECIES: DUF2478 domain-containing protein [Nitrospirillum]|uniref:Uncharacterized protein DUF2478 n=1 Tax=Nitrospirillum amazonense TaxID=28077 RepID=A0A560G9H2_9PROT|nr:DUF2478 domain-containing protein [Nitrospirillum amazonense]MEC4591736.1 DUF2478 domain-containing protein [Nitrospirillum amazonense]TWB30555.1 uncharacterized protein DUF2478 [Nitrospirillum amazonense]
MPDSVAYTDNLLNLAAVIYQPEDDVDTLLADFALGLRDRGRRVGGIVQRNRKGDCGPVKLMEVMDLSTGRVIPICQNLGPGSVACRLDTGGLADAALAVAQAVADRVELVLVNKFGKTEAEGRGLRGEIAAAIDAGLPVLTAVPWRFYDAWTAFTGGYGTTLVCNTGVITTWWEDWARRADWRQAN